MMCDAWWLRWYGITRPAQKHVLDVNPVSPAKQWLLILFFPVYWWVLQRCQVWQMRGSNLICCMNSPFLLLCCGTRGTWCPRFRRTVQTVQAVQEVWTLCSFVSRRDRASLGWNAHPIYGILWQQTIKTCGISIIPARPARLRSLRSDNPRDDQNQYIILHNYWLLSTTITL